MELTMIAGGPCVTADDDKCGNGDCPTIYTTDRGTIAIQGYDIDRPTPAGESVVEIPKAVLKEAIRALGW
ncbi:hypothetical protein ACIBJD_31350 [Kitasatospora sp. NPDC050467]|uniref:hypothetical protein n=1 Tax=Kitasatospora sp. NPDC050467 TaxID=3364053 RepID=UPI003799D5C8